jgi:Tol biopolymer transport system component
LGKELAKIMTDSFLGVSAVVANHHSTDPSDPSEGVSFFVHYYTGTTVQRNFKERGRGEENNSIGRGGNHAEGERMRRWTLLFLAAGVVGGLHLTVPAGLAQAPAVKERATLRCKTSVYSVVFSGDGKFLASGGGDSEPAERGVSLWDPATGKQTAFIKSSTAPVMRLAASADGKLLAWAHEEGAVVKLWDLPGGKLKGNLTAPGGRARALAFAPDGRTLATGNQDGVVTLWDLATGKATTTLKGHGDSIRALAFTPDSKVLASSSADETVKLWDVAAAKEKTTLAGTGIASALAFTPDGKTLVTTAAGDKEIKLWDWGAGKERAKVGPLRFSAYSLALAPDGKTLAATDGDEIHLWDAGTGKEKATLKGHGSTVWCLAFSPDGKTLASAGSGDKTVRLWEVAANAGEVVWAEWRPNAWFHGKIARVDGKDLHIAFDDGDKATVDASRIAPDRVPGKDMVKVGTRVLARFKQIRFYPGKITKIEGDRYDVKFDDGDVDNVALDDLRLIGQ